MVKVTNIINFGTGMLLGVIGVSIWNYIGAFIWDYSPFLYYSAFTFGLIALLILIEFIKSHKKSEQNQRKPFRK